MGSTLFPLGRTVATPGALRALEQNQELPFRYLDRHACGDWGDLDPDDQRANERSLTDDTRLLSVYHLPDATTIWVITEADRSATTILLPDEY